MMFPLIFPLVLIPPSSGFVQGHLKETFFFFFAGFTGDRRLSGQVCPFEAKLCVS